jgi:hypothetical protein
MNFEEIYIETSKIQTEIPDCQKLPDNISLIIRELGKEWNSAIINPKINQEVISKWDKLIDEWYNAVDIPIIVRKSGGLRGSEIEHKTGRKIIISDNSPAQWVCYQALLGNVPKLDDIRDFLKKDKLPISFAVKKAEKNLIKYKCTLGKYSINKSGWKLCHKKSVGLNTSNEISQIDILNLKLMFLNLLKPSNFFLLPKVWGGLGESKEFIEEME